MKETPEMAKLGKQIADTGLWRKIVREVRDQKIADTEEGKLSSTKIEVVEERYKRRGGGFNTPKKATSKDKTMATKISRELGRQKRAANQKKKVK
jgi:hypothetical protein